MLPDIFRISSLSDMAQELGFLIGIPGDSDADWLGNLDAYSYQYQNNK